MRVQREKPPPAGPPASKPRAVSLPAAEESTKALNPQSREIRIAARRNSSVSAVQNERQPSARNRSLPLVFGGQRVKLEHKILLFNLEIRHIKTQIAEKFKKKLSVEALPVTKRP